ncbi:MAG: L-histidine N(alpha)-methyltransferase [Salibacteraceae bacterium]
MKSKERQAFAAEVKEGLSKKQTQLSSKWLYDERGDKLFVEIMNMPEYYLTNCEFEILSKQTKSIINALDVDDKEFDLYELGAGDGTKTIELLKGLGNHRFTYRPIDISKHAIDSLERRVRVVLPKINVEGLKGEYFKVLNSLSYDKPKVILFLGSNIGNFSDDVAKSFLQQLSSVMRSGDKLLLGFDLKKSKEIVLPAYNDAQGFTAAFNLNLLDRINEELGGSFNVDEFEHDPIYDEEKGWAMSYLKSLREQEVHIDYLKETFHFEKGERIYMEVSRKYDPETIQAITENTQLKLHSEFFDRRKYYCDAVFERI